MTEIHRNRTGASKYRPSPVYGGRLWKRRPARDHTSVVMEGDIDAVVFPKPDVGFPRPVRESRRRRGERPWRVAHSPPRGRAHWRKSTARDHRGIPRASPLSRRPTRGGHHRPQHREVEAHLKIARPATVEGAWRVRVCCVSSAARAWAGGPEFEAASELVRAPGTQPTSSCVGDVEIASSSTLRALGATIGPVEVNLATPKRQPRLPRSAALHRHRDIVAEFGESRRACGRWACVRQPRSAGGCHRRRLSA